eukprot:Partr_v1_DN24187_c0_g1_i1_m71127 putative GLI pathogenesis-related 2
MITNIFAIFSVVFFAFISVQTHALPVNCEKGIPQTYQPLTTRKMPSFGRPRKSKKNKKPTKPDVKTAPQPDVTDGIPYSEAPPPVVPQNTPTPAPPAPDPPASAPLTPAEPENVPVVSAPVTESQPVSTPASAENLSAAQRAILDIHNQKRALHNAPALEWDANLAAQATSYASQCQWKHSQTPGAGENLYVTTSSDTCAIEAANGWYDEIKDYNFGNQGFSSGTGHLTQMLWRASTKLGCGVVQCPGSMMGWGMDAHYVVCQYQAQGNVLGQFEENVAPVSGYGN